MNSCPPKRTRASFVLENSEAAVLTSVLLAILLRDTRTRERNRSFDGESRECSHTIGWERDSDGIRLNELVHRSGIIS